MLTDNISKFYLLEHPTYSKLLEVSYVAPDYFIYSGSGIQQNLAETMQWSSYSRPNV